MTGRGWQSGLRCVPPARSPRGGPRGVDLRGVAPAQRSGVHPRGVDPQPAPRGAALVRRVVVLRRGVGLLPVAAAPGVHAEEW